MTNDYGWPEIFPREPSNLLSKKEQEEYPWIFKCGQPLCYWQTAHPSEEHARETKENHTCGQENRMPKPTGNHSVPSGPNIHERLWVHLDEFTEGIMVKIKEKKETDALQWGEADERALDQAKFNARGLAIAVYELGHPGYESPDAVVKLAAARYKAKQAGEEMPPTVGIDGHNPHLDKARSKAMTAEAKASASTPAAIATVEESPTGLIITKKGGKVLAPGEIDQLKLGLKNGLDKGTLAQVYKITLDDIEKIAAFA